MNYLKLSLTNLCGLTIKNRKFHLSKEIKAGQTHQNKVIENNLLT